VSFLSLPKEKERGNKGRAIYRAVGSQVTYATHTAPAAYALRVTLFTTSTCTDSLVTVTALVENGGLWQWIVADNRKQFQTISDSITVLANWHRLPQIAVT